MIYASLNQPTVPAAVQPRLRAYLDSLTLPQLERLARATPEEAARLMNVQLVNGLGEYDEDGLGWIQLAIMAASAIAGAAKKKKAKKKQKQQQQQAEAEARAQAAQQTADLAKIKAESEKQQKELAAQSAAKSTQGAVPIWPVAVGGVAILAGFVYILTRKRK